MHILTVDVGTGDMMLTGNLGLLPAYASQDNTVREAVERRLGRAGAQSLDRPGPGVMV